MKIYEITLNEQELDVMSADDKEVVLKDPKSGIETKIPRDLKSQV